MMSEPTSPQQSNRQVIFEEQCQWCGKPYSTDEPIMPVQHASEERVAWLHSDCRLARSQHELEGYESRQYVEAREGVVLGAECDREHVEYRSRLPESYRFGADQIDWSDFVEKRVFTKW